ncbi:MAG: hypothetical protein DWQ19_11310 [Crenarchaeota archaeon]|nr:MAG: hypothetical protein DWQ19_11310 [Thermoproteota archaeon]
MLKCERCGNNHDGKFGSGRFCSENCSRKRKTSNTTKEKIRKSLEKYRKENPNPGYDYVCEKCGKEYHTQRKKRENRRAHCDDCKRQTPHTLRSATSILDYSKRTVGKILKRAGASCAICGYKKSRCDIHHIIPKSKGGSDDLDNLIIVCPNHHRELHELKEFTIDELKEKSIYNLWGDFKVFYNPKIDGVYMLAKEPNEIEKKIIELIRENSNVINHDFFCMIQNLIKSGNQERLLRYLPIKIRERFEYWKTLSENDKKKIKVTTCMVRSGGWDGMT